MVNKKLIIYIISIIFLATAVQGAITDNIIAVWDMHAYNVSGTTVRNAVSDIYNGTLTGGATATTDFIVNNSAHYDGDNDYLAITGDPLSLNETDFTICAWLKVHDRTDFGDVAIYGSYKDDSNRWGFDIGGSTAGSEGVRYFVREGGATEIDISWNFVNQNNENRHVCLVRDSTSNYTYYNNGTLVSSQGDVDTQSAHGGNGRQAWLAFSAVDDNKFYDGEMDETAIWHRKLTSLEIAGLYANGTAGIGYPWSAGGGAPPAGGGGETNFTITAESDENGATIMDFNATVNGTFYTTSSGSINTNMSNNTIESLNITVESRGFSDYNRFNYNLSINLKANMTPLKMNVLTNWTLPSPVRTGETISLNCTFNNTHNHNVLNITRFIDNINESTTYSTTGTEYNISTSDFLDALRYRCIVYTNWSSYDSNNLTIASNQTNTNSEINVLGYTQIPIASGLVNITLIDLELTNNPSYLLLTRLLNESLKARNVSVETFDLLLQHASNITSLEFNENITEYNITLNPAQLQIGFILQNGSYYTVDGIIHDNNKTMNWTNSSLVVVQQSLEMGKVQVLFNANENTNWTQYYEYDNDYLTFIDVNITLILNPIKGQWYQITDYSGMPIEGATVRLYGAYPSETWQTKTLYGQRLTDDEGYAFFYVDEAVQGRLIVSAPNYETVTILTLPLDDNAQTQATAKIITIKEDLTSTGDNRLLYYLRNTYTNETGNIHGMVNIYDYDVLEINTDYRIGQGLGKITLNSCDYFGVCPFILYQGTDIEAVAVSNITFHIWADSIYFGNKTIILEDTADINDIFVYDTIDSNVLRPIIFIALIFLAGGLGFIFKNSEVGLITFDIGALVLAIITWEYAFLAFVVIAKYVSLWLKRIISE